MTYVDTIEILEDLASPDEVILGLRFDCDDEKVVALSLGFAERIGRKLLAHVAAHRRPLVTTPAKARFVGIPSS